MVLEYIDSPTSFHSTHASNKSVDLKASQKYKRISLEKRKLLLEKIFFENKKIKKVLLLIFPFFISFPFVFRLPKNLTSTTPPPKPSCTFTEKKSKNQKSKKIQKKQKDVALAPSIPNFS
jgi:hypothetical protein